MTTPHASLPLANWAFWRVVWATLVFLFVGLIFWLIYRFHQVLFVLFVAIIIGTILRPTVAWMHRRGLPQKAGVILIYLLLLVLLMGFALLLFPLITEQSATMTASVPGYYQNLREWLVEHSNPMLDSLNAVFPTTLPFADPVQQTGQELLDSAGQVLGYVASAASGIFTAVAILLLAYYWTVDGPRIVRSLLRLVPSDRRENIRELILAIETKVGAYIAGQGVLMLIVGSMALIAYWLIGLPYVLVLAFVAGVMEAVPLIGPLIGAVPAVLVALSVGSDKLIWVIVAIVVIQQVENSILMPRVMRKAVGVNPFVTLLALFAFGSLLGVAGAFMAIPITAIVQLLLNRFVFDPEPKEPAIPNSRNVTGRLRYEAQTLAQDLRHQARFRQTGADRDIRQQDQVLDQIEAIAIDLDTLLTHHSEAT